MLNRAARRPGPLTLRGRVTPAGVIAGCSLFVALGGTAAAADKLIGSRDLGWGVVTSRHIRDATIQVRDLSPGALAALRSSGSTGPAGAAGAAGLNGTTGSSGANGVNGTAGPAGSNGATGLAGLNGAAGPAGAAGTNGAAGLAGTNGAAGVAGANGPNGGNGANGPAGIDGTNGLDGTNGTNGTNGTDGTNGTIAPLSATAGLVALPTSTSPTVVVTLAIPAGHYVVLAKTQLSHTGAGDSIDCQLRVGGTTVDSIAMKTLPALAAIPASMQAVTTTTTSTSPTVLSVQCHVLTANGSADANSLIAIPTA